MPTSTTSRSCARDSPAQRSRDAVRERAPTRAGEGDRAGLAESLPAVRTILEVALVAREEVVRLVDLHQPGGAQRMAEGEEPAEGIRPSLCHALDAALVGEAHREQEGKLDAGEGVVGDSRRRGREDGDGPARIVRGGRERLANGGGEEERRLAMEEVLVARTFEIGRASCRGR